MNESERTEAFLTAFKELENALLSIAQIKDEGHVSFFRALNEIYYQRKNPALSQYENYDFLKSASDLRNLLSHENDVCIPTEDYLEKFLALKEAIIHPLTCFDIATKKIISCSLDEPLSKVIKRMEYSSLSHLPVLDEEGYLLGIFSRSSLFDYLAMNETFNYDQKMKIRDFEEFLPIEEHLNERFIFVGRYERVDRVFSYLYKNKEHDKVVSLLLVTQHGKADERLLGIISLTDLARIGEKKRTGFPVQDH